MPSSSELGQENYVGHFFTKSRLHFIGSWKVRYEQLLEQIAKEKAQHESHPRLGKRKLEQLENSLITKQAVATHAPQPGPDGYRCVLHIDMDCFFAAVSLLTRPELRDQPVVVCSNDQGTNSEVSCANYPARAFGVKAGWPLSKARNACATLQTVPYEFEEYMRVAELMYRSLFKLTPFVNTLSCDEAFVDITHKVLSTAKSSSAKDRAARAVEVVKALRAEIQGKTGGCTASVGIGSNMLTARIATAKAKPDGFFLFDLENTEAKAMLLALNIRSLPQLGHKTCKVIEEAFQATTCKDLQKIPLSRLQAVLGPKKGSMAHKHCRGIDTREWVPEGARQRQTIGAQISYGVRMNSEQETEEFLRGLSTEVITRMKAAKVGQAARRITLTVWQAKPDADPRYRKGHLGHGQCNILSRTATPHRPVTTAAEIHSHAMSLMKKVGTRFSDIRGLGVTAAGFEDLAALPPESASIQAFFQAQDKDSSSLVNRAPSKRQLQIVPPIPSFSSSHNSGENAGSKNSSVSPPLEEEPSTHSGLDNLSVEQSESSLTSKSNNYDNCNNDDDTNKGSNNDTGWQGRGSIEEKAHLKEPENAYLSIQQALQNAFLQTPLTLEGPMQFDKCPLGLSSSRICSGNQCESPGCILKERLVAPSKLLYRYCEVLPLDDAQRLVEASRAFAALGWPELCQPFHDACSQIAIHLYRSATNGLYSTQM